MAIFARVLSLAMVLALAPVSAQADVGLFGSHETRNGDFRVFVKWTGMLARQQDPAAGQAQPVDALPASGGCKPNPRFACPGEDWPQLIQQLRGLSPAMQLTRVNAYFNRAPYILDPINWGVADYWAAIKEFFRKDGDCEDYAIAKYMTLKAVGFAADAMRVVVVQDTNLDSAHAVLAVVLDGETHILDNQVDAVLPQGAVHHYRPIYSINETAWWLHS